jgi:hypothetical protein
MNKLTCLGTFMGLAALNACSPQNNQAEVANLAPSSNKMDVLVYEMKAGKILETGVSGKLVNLMTDKDPENDCSTASQSSFGTSIFMDPAYKDKELFGALTKSGYFTDPDSAVKKLDGLLFSSGGMPIAVCVNKLKYFARLVATKNVLKNSKKPGSLTYLYEAAKQDAKGYTSVITLELEIDKYSDEAGSGAQKKPFSYYALSRIGISAKPSGDSDEWTFGRSEADILAIRKNVEIYFKLGSATPTPSGKEPNFCKTYTSKLLGSTLEEARTGDDFEGADMSKMTYDISVKKGSAELASQKGLKALNKFVNFSFTVKEPGTYTYTVIRQLPQISYPGRANMGRPPNDGYKGETPVTDEFKVTADKDCNLLPPPQLSTYGDAYTYINFVK